MNFNFPLKLIVFALGAKKFGPFFYSDFRMMVFKNDEKLVAKVAVAMLAAKNTPLTSKKHKNQQFCG